MAKLQYTIRDQFVFEFELLLMPPEHYVPPVEWVKARVTFRFWKGFPEISIERTGQDVGDMRFLITSIREMVNEGRESFDFYPMEPDYNIDIKKDGSNYNVRVVMDATGSQTTGVYCGMGPILELNVDEKSLLAFAEDIERELEEIIPKLTSNTNNV